MILTPGTSALLHGTTRCVILVDVVLALMYFCDWVSNGDEDVWFQCDVIPTRCRDGA
jgi:hypothetical protein